MTSFISASFDIAFKALFVRNRNLLRPFLSDILDISFTEGDEVSIMSMGIPPDSVDGKLSRLDVLAKVGGRVFNIEIQTRKKGFTPKRTYYYLKSIFAYDFKSGDEYDLIEQTFTVNILDFKYLDCEEYHSSFTFHERTRKAELSDDLIIYYFELPKVPNENVAGDRKKKWMQLIKARNEETLEMIKANTDSATIQEGVDAVLALNADPSSANALACARKRSSIMETIWRV